jgi:hypothetical protein
VLLLLAIPVVYRSFLAILIVSVTSQLFVSNGLLDAYTLDTLGVSQSKYYGRYRLYASVSWGVGSIMMGTFVDYYNFNWLFLMFAILATAMVVLVALYIPGDSNDNGNDDHDHENNNHDHNHNHHNNDDDHENHRDDRRHTRHDDDDDQDQLRQPLLSDVCQDDVDPSALGLRPVNNTDEEGLHRHQHRPDDTNNSNDDNDTDIHTDDDGNDGGGGGGRGNVSDLFRLAFCTDARITWFLMEVVVMGAGMATVERLLFLYMVNDLHSSTLLCGLSVGVNVLFELPIFWFSDWILSRFSHDVMYILAMIFFVVRMYGYTLLLPSTRWWILVLECMHGVTFACFWMTTLDIASGLIHLSPSTKYWSTSIPSGIQMLYNAVGVSVGVMLGGYAMQVKGSRWMYRTTAGSVGVVLLVHIVGTVWCRRCRCRRRQRWTLSSSRREVTGSFLPVFGGELGEVDCVRRDDDGNGDVDGSDIITTPTTETTVATFSMIEHGALISTD